MSAPEPRPLVPRPDPPPGMPRLRRRLADRHDLRDALLAAMAEDRTGTGPTLGSRLDVAGDPTVVIVSELWSRVADSIAAYTELTAGERYLGTAQDWTDLRRTTDLLGHRPAQRTASRGWVRFLTDPHASPQVPAGTRVQAPGTATEDAQTFETIADTHLRADWASLTVTAVPRPTSPPGHTLRMLTDPGFAAGDRVLLMAEHPAAYVTMPTTWQDWLGWLALVIHGATSTRSVRGIVRITKQQDDLGAFLLTTDRKLDILLAPRPSTTYAAYRVRTLLTLAHRLEKLSYVNSDGIAATANVTYTTSEQEPVTLRRLLVADASAVTPGVGIVVWGSSAAHVTSVSAVDTLNWSVAPGTRSQVGRIRLADALPSSWGDSLGNVNQSVQIALVDDRVVAQHYELPPLAPGEQRLRLHPRPAVVPERLAVRTSAGWEMSACSLDAGDTPADDGGMLLALTTPFTGTATAAEATANLVQMRHGSSNSGPLTLAGSTAIVAGPVTGDVGPSGQVTNSLSVRVDGVAFEEVGSLYGRGPGEQVFTARLAADGSLVLRFGDGVVGAAPRGDVTARWRLGGGIEGELDATRIDTMLGSVKGVRKVAGIGTTTGAADQEATHRMRHAAAARMRALDRAVSASDLADLAMTVPGTSHAAAWHGPGPNGCPCGRVGLHVASLRLTATGIRAPLPTELTSLSGYLATRRDTNVPLCVAAGITNPVTLTVMLAADPTRDEAVVRAAVETALKDPAGPLAPRLRTMGLPLDTSDVMAVIHRVPGVLGVTALEIGHGLREASTDEAAIGRTPVARYEVLSVGTAEVVVV